MGAWNAVLVGILCVGTILLLQWAVARHWGLPFRQPTIYYSKLHKFLHLGLNAASLLTFLSVSFAIANGDIDSDFRLFLLPVILIWLTEPLKVFMEWKYAENRILYKANLVNLVGGTALMVVMIFVFVKFLDIPFL